MSNDQILGYVCAQCGSCCRCWIVEADAADVLREPAIAEQCKLLDGGRKGSLLDAAWSIGVGESHLCPFFDPRANLCATYPTRPQECLVFAPGSDKCTKSRRRFGKPPLNPVSMDDTPLNRLREAVRTRGGG